MEAVVARTAFRWRVVGSLASRDEATFEAFRARIGELYPGVHAALERRVVAGGALHLIWRGGPAPATVLMAHHDVVPVAEQHKVRLACHPQDPGLPSGFQGVDAVLSTVEGLKKFVGIKESAYHGLNF